MELAVLVASGDVAVRHFLSNPDPEHSPSAPSQIAISITTSSLDLFLDCTIFSSITGTLVCISGQSRFG